MSIQIHSRWGEDPHPALRLLYGVLRLIGQTLRWTAFSVLTLLAPFIRIGFAIGALGGFLACLLAAVRPHRHPFPYGMMMTFSVICALLRVLLDRLLIALAP